MESFFVKKLVSQSFQKVTIEVLKQNMLESLSCHINLPKNK